MDCDDVALTTDQKVGGSNPSERAGWLGGSRWPSVQQAGSEPNVEPGVGFVTAFDAESEFSPHAVDKLG